jgi:hypothetical protein
MSQEMDTVVGDKFADLMSVTAEIDRRLSDFRPRAALKTAVHTIEKPRFPVIEYHNQLDSMNPQDVLALMDRCGLEHVLNITMQAGPRALNIMDRYYAAAPDRFSCISWMDWNGIESSDFVQITIDRLHRLVEHGPYGAKFWKDFGLTLRGADGELLRIDDERFAPIFEECRTLGLPVMYHTADPTAFFDPTDAENERYEELAAHPDWGFSSSPVPKRTLLEQRNRIIARHPATTFVGAHCAECSEDLDFLARQLDEPPNLLIDISAGTPELGR